MSSISRQQFRVAWRLSATVHLRERQDLEIRICRNVVNEDTSPRKRITNSRTRTAHSTIPTSQRVSRSRSRSFDRARSLSLDRTRLRSGLLSRLRAGLLSRALSRSLDLVARTQKRHAQTQKGHVPHVHQARPTLCSYHALIFTARVGKDQSSSEENTGSEKSPWTLPVKELEETLGVQRRCCAPRG